MEISAILGICTVYNSKPERSKYRGIIMPILPGLAARFRRDMFETMTLDAETKWRTTSFLLRRVDQYTGLFMMRQVARQTRAIHFKRCVRQRTESSLEFCHDVIIIDESSWIAFRMKLTLDDVETFNSLVG